MAKGQYRKYIAQGKCGVCGKVNDNGKAECDDCRAYRKKYNKEKYDFCISLKICPKCGNALFGNEHNCVECRARQAGYMQTYREKHYEESKEYQRESQKKLRRDRIELGICTYCRKPLDDKTYKMCPMCRNKFARKRAENRAKNQNKDHLSIDDKRKLGICAYCNEKVVPGKRLCEEHYRRRLARVDSQKVLDKRAELKNRWWINGKK